MQPSSVITYPIPLYANVPINAFFYEPNGFDITAISLGTMTTVTTSVNHNYVIGNLVRLIIPFGYGCIALNEQTGYVVSIPASNQVTINLSSHNVTPFINAALKQQPQITPVGDVNSGQINTDGLINQGTFIPGSYINISPL
jgi:hypothetical protein